MQRRQITLVAMLAFALAAPVAAAEGDRAPFGAKPAASKKGHGGAFLEKPIEPAPEREQKPRDGWNGFYGGLNGGSASSDR